MKVKITMEQLNFLSSIFPDMTVKELLALIKK